MATVLPTPMAQSYYHEPLSYARQPAPTPYDLPHHRPSRPNLKRGSPLSVFRNSNGFSADAPGLQRISVGDSSDDDVQPMKFSALTRALLEDDDGVGKAVTGTSSPKSLGEKEGSSSTPVRSGARLRISRRSSPVDGPDRREPSPRVVHLTSSQTGSGSSTLKRSTSTYGAQTQTSYAKVDTPQPNEVITPGVGRSGLGTNGALRRPRTGSNASANGLSRPGSAGADHVREQANNSKRITIKTSLRREGIFRARAPLWAGYGTPLSPAR